MKCFYFSAFMFSQPQDDKLFVSTNVKCFTIIHQIFSLCRPLFRQTRNQGFNFIQNLIVYRDCLFYSKRPSINKKAYTIHKETLKPLP